MREMEDAIQDVRRDFGEMRERLDSLYTILPLLKGLVKQKDPINVEYPAGSSDLVRTSQPHNQGHFSTHSSSLDGGDSDEFNYKGGA